PSRRRLVADEEPLLLVLPLSSDGRESLHDCPFSQSAIFAPLRQSYITGCRADDILVRLEARTGRLRVDMGDDFLGSAARTHAGDGAKDKMKILSHITSF